MKLLIATLLVSQTLTFTPSLITPRPSFALNGKLDDFSKDIIPTDESKKANPERDSYRANVKDSKDVDRFGPGTYEDYVDFGDEFDGGDGQMGVAGDGVKGLEKIGEDSEETVVKARSAKTVGFKSRERSAKNAWGTSNGYADKLRDEGMDTAKAQMLENWQNQNNVKARRKEARYQTEEFDPLASNKMEDEDWRKLGTFGVERNADFDLDEEFGAVVGGDTIESELTLTANMGGTSFTELNIANDFMGFADFRAAFTGDSSKDFTIEPTEGALSKDPVEFIVRFNPQGPELQVGTLVVETEDFKKTWNVVGKTG
ncbi:hypothetical protein TrRE_jg3596 [Triparma retinervis]|uniref:Uncharacterized protein n=1 Tax=Triparma retinervis TaxID=2557542 RepID=A0A9W7G926_9STRA|nr:hypothetical protein TrRE_jg3596 [Triparma retinervis]